MCMCMYVQCTLYKYNAHLCVLYYYKRHAMSHDTGLYLPPLPLPL